MWFLYVNGAYVCQSDCTIRMIDLLAVLMECEGINTIELRPEKEF